MSASPKTPSNKRRRTPPRKPAGGVDPLRELSDRQLAVIRELVTGKTVVGVAATTGVGRSSIYDWMKSTPFTSELQRQRCAANDAVADGFRRLDRVLAGVLLEHVEEGGVDAALTVAKLRGIHRIDTTPAEPLDIEEIIENEVEARFRAHEREILDEWILKEIARGRDQIAPAREAVRRIVEHDLRRQACEYGDCDPADLPLPVETFTGMQWSSTEPLAAETTADDDRTDHERPGTVPPLTNDPVDDAVDGGRGTVPSADSGGLDQAVGLVAPVAEPGLARPVDTNTPADDETALDPQQAPVPAGEPEAVGEHVTDPAGAGDGEAAGQLDRWQPRRGCPPRCP
ncbi:MAG: hypothetical protein V9G12_07750 [Microthrixaceae bacterium]